MVGDPYDLRIARTVLTSRGWLAEQPPSLRKLVLDSARALRLRAGMAIYRTGDEPDGLYGLTTGRVKFSSIRSDGRETVCGIATPGSWFGEVSAFDGLPRSQSAIVLTDALVVHLSSPLFQQIAETHPGFLMNFALILTRNLRGTLYYINEIVGQAPRIRIARLLSLLVQKDADAGQCSDFVIQVNQNDLARMAGLSRQTTNVVLGLLVGDGLIELRYGAIILLDAKRLADEH